MCSGYVRDDVMFLGAACRARDTIRRKSEAHYTGTLTYNISLIIP